MIVMIRLWIKRVGWGMFFALGLPYVCTLMWQGAGCAGQLANRSVYFFQDGRQYGVSRPEYLKGSCYSLLPEDAPVEAVRAVLVLLQTNLAYYERQSCLQSAVTCYTPAGTRAREMGLIPFMAYERKMDGLLDELGDEQYLIGETLYELPYFALSAGTTADGAARAGGAYDYLVSVDSAWDVEAVSYMDIRTVSVQMLRERWGIAGDLEEVQMEYEARTGYVSEIVWEGGSVSAEQAANDLGLPSTAFTLSVSGESVRVMCKGFGHGLGLSLYGACAAAEEGLSYQQILTHYFPAPLRTSE